MTDKLCVVTQTSRLSKRDLHRIRGLPANPLSLAQTRLQSAPTGTYSGFLDCCTKSVQAEGWGVMVKGMYLAQARAFLVHGSIFFLYEHVLEGVLQFRDKDDMETKVYHLS